MFCTFWTNFVAVKTEQNKFKEIFFFFFSFLFFLFFFFQNYKIKSCNKNINTIQKSKNIFFFNNNTRCNSNLKFFINARLFLLKKYITSSGNICLQIFFYNCLLFTYTYIITLHIQHWRIQVTTSGVTRQLKSREGGFYRRLSISSPGARIEPGIL